jgi:hypothetical protein
MSESGRVQCSESGHVRCSESGHVRCGSGHVRIRTCQHNDDVHRRRWRQLWHRRLFVAKRWHAVERAQVLYNVGGFGASETDRLYISSFTAVRRPFFDLHARLPLLQLRPLRKKVCTLLVPAVSNHADEANGPPVCRGVAARDAAAAQDSIGGEEAHQTLWQCQQSRQQASTLPACYQACGCRA